MSDVSTGFSSDFVTHVRGVGKAGGWEAGERRENDIIYIYTQIFTRVCFDLIYSAGTYMSRHAFVDLIR